MVPYWRVKGRCPPFSQKVSRVDGAGKMDLPMIGAYPFPLRGKARMGEG